MTIVVRPHQVRRLPARIVDLHRQASPTPKELMKIRSGECVDFRREMEIPSGVQLLVYHGHFAASVVAVP